MQMKKSILVAIAALLIFAVAGFGGETSPSLYVGGGISLPMGPQWFKDEHNMGFNFSGGVGFKVGQFFEIIGRGGFHSFPIDKEVIKAELEAYMGEDLTGVSISGGSLQSLEFGADLKVLLVSSQSTSSIRPYVIAGLGMANLKYSDFKITYQGTSISFAVPGDVTKIALDFGAGFEYMISPKVGLTFDGRYVLVTTEGESIKYLPVSVGLKFMLGSD